MRNFLMFLFVTALSMALPAMAYAHGSNVFESGHDTAQIEAEAHEHRHASGESAAEFDELHEQIERLEKRLIARDEHARLTDILGGIGYIVGITGIAYYYLGNRRERNATPIDSVKD